MVKVFSFEITVSLVAVGFYENPELINVMKTFIYFNVLQFINTE